MLQQKPPDLDEQGNPVITKPPDLDNNGEPIQSGLQRDWKTANTPLLPQFAEGGRKFAEAMDNPTLETSPTGQGGIRDFMLINSARIRGLLGGLGEGAGTVASEMTTPLSIATLGMGGLEYGAGKLGLAAIARAAGYGTKALSAPFAIHGGSEVIRPDATLGERGMGLAEMAGGAAGMLHTPVGKSAKGIKPENVRISEEIPVDPSWFDGGLPLGATESTPVKPTPPIRPPVNPAVSKTVIEPLKPNSQGIENQPLPKSADTLFATPDDVHVAYNAGQISRDHALKLLTKLHKTNVKTIKTAKPTTESIEATTNEPVQRVQPKTYIFGKEEVTPEFVAKARSQGYEFQGLTDKGDYRFDKTTESVSEPITSPIESTSESLPPVESITSPIESSIEPDYTALAQRLSQDIPERADIGKVQPMNLNRMGAIDITPISAETITPSKTFAKSVIPEQTPSAQFSDTVVPPEVIPPVVKPNLGIPEVVELMRSGQVKNMSDLQKELGISFNETRVIWQQAKDVIGPKDYGVISAARGKGIAPVFPPVKQPGVGLVPVQSKPKPVAPPVTERPGLVVPKEKITEEFIENAKMQGYEVDGVEANGDVRFRSSEAPFDPSELASSNVTPPTNVVPPTSVAPTTKKAARATAVPRMATESADLNSMVKSLTAMRRRGMNQFSEQDKVVYRGLLDSIRQHPDLPPEMKAAWDAVTGPVETTPFTSQVEATTAPGTSFVPLKTQSPVQKWKTGLSELDAQKAPDEAYRALLSEKATLQQGETWRGKVNKLIGMAEQKAKQGGGFGQRLMGQRGEITIDLGGFNKQTPKDIKHTLESFPPDKIVTVEGAQALPQNVKKLFDAGFRFLDTNERGQLRFQKKEGISQGPILESEVGTLRPTKAGIKADSLRDQLGAIQDAQKASAIAEAFSLPRGLMAAVDFSFPLRQGLPFIHKPAFWKAMKPMFASWASEEGFQASQAAISKRPLFKKRYDAKGKELPSFADDAGLKLSDLTKFNEREEAIMSTWAEKVPGVRPSNRAYTTFANNLRADVFESLIKDAKIFGVDPKANLVAARNIADFVNTFTGRGSLTVDIPSNMQRFFGKDKQGNYRTQLSMERSAQTLNAAFFAPRLMASRVKILASPLTYMMATPQLRKEVLKSLLAITTFGTAVLKMAELGGATVSLDPTNADFGKAKIGNIRIDPWGGFQQYVVLASRMINGKTTSSTTERSYDLANPRGPYGQDYGDILQRFGRGKANPVLGFAYSLLSHQTEMSGKKMNFSTTNPFDNSIAQRFIPLLMQDIYAIGKEDPSMLGLAIPAAFGMGTQVYGNKFQ